MRWHLGRDWELDHAARRYRRLHYHQVPEPIFDICSACWRCPFRAKQASHAHINIHPPYLLGPLNLFLPHIYSITDGTCPRTSFIFAHPPATCSPNGARPSHPHFPYLTVDSRYSLGCLQGVNDHCPSSLHHSTSQGC